MHCDYMKSALQVVDARARTLTGWQVGLKHVRVMLTDMLACTPQTECKAGIVDTLRQRVCKIRDVSAVYVVILLLLPHAEKIRRSVDTQPWDHGDHHAQLLAAEYRYQS